MPQAVDSRKSSFPGLKSSCRGPNYTLDSQRNAPRSATEPRRNCIYRKRRLFGHGYRSRRLSNCCFPLAVAHRMPRGHGLTFESWRADMLADNLKVSLCGMLKALLLEPELDWGSHETCVETKIERSDTAVARARISQRASFSFFTLSQRGIVVL
jgi:hypothetical protein